MANPYTAYLESKVLAASPLELVHLAYEAAIDTLAEARDHLAGKRFLLRIQAITRVQQILIQLQSSLDFEKGGDLSANLRSLYSYMLSRLNDGNRLESDEPFAEVEHLLRTLDEAWKQIAAGDSAAAAATVSGSSPWMMTSEPAPVYTAAGYL
jgi:flagellar protein FliS